MRSAPRGAGRDPWGRAPVAEALRRAVPAKGFPSTWPSRRSVTLTGLRNAMGAAGPRSPNDRPLPQWLSWNLRSASRPHSRPTARVLLTVTVARRAVIGEGSSVESRGVRLAHSDQHTFVRAALANRIS